ncbi:hypothetical protein L209DRAFT_740104 [Thermothelomyces heterothallicus CBS 203.75]
MNELRQVATLYQLPSVAIIGSKILAKPMYLIGKVGLPNNLRADLEKEGRSPFFVFEGLVRAIAVFSRAPKATVVKEGVYLVLSKNRGVVGGDFLPDVEVELSENEAMEVVELYFSGAWVAILQFVILEPSLGLEKLSLYVADTTDSPRKRQSSYWNSPSAY